MLKIIPPLFPVLLIALFLLPACTSSNSSSDKYAYLRKTNKNIPKTVREPYEVVDIAILDTARSSSSPKTQTKTQTPTKTNPQSPSKTETPSKTQSNPSLSTIAIQQVLQAAKSYLGTPYQYGGTSQQGIDCSGLVFASYLSIDKKLPRTSRALAEIGQVVTKEQILTGDLVFFSSRNDGNINHVGLVTQVEGPQISFIHATVSKGVREDRLDVGYWQVRFVKGVRIE